MHVCARICVYRLYDVVTQMALAEIVLLAQLVFSCSGARILAVAPFPGQSHMVVISALTQELASRGHHVTVISSHPLSGPQPNYTDIKVPDLHLNQGVTDLYSIRHMSYMQTMLAMWNLGNTICENAFQSPEIQQLIHSKDLKFDLIILEAFFNECFLGFAHKFQAPVISICTFGGMSWMADTVGSPSLYSFIPNGLLEYSDRMGFWDRLDNGYWTVLTDIVRAMWYMPKQNSLMKKYFDSVSGLPNIWTLEKQTALLLTNTHFSQTSPRPLNPNMVEVGGMHIKSAKKVPQDLKKFLDSSPDGIIYFSMGSVLKGSLLPEDKRNAFVKAFAQLKQKVLWKWEGDNLPNKPSNVKIEKWLPQNDILAHPNVILFITHGGLLSTQEAIYHGVPMIGIPIFGDQLLNVKRAERKGFGLLLPFDNITETSVKWAITEILTNKSYLTSARHMSRLQRDQPIHPLDNAVFWTEYIIRHKGAPHIRSASLTLSFTQYFMLDCLALVILIIGLIIFGMFTLAGNLVRRARENLKDEKSEKDGKNRTREKSD